MTNSIIVAFITLFTYLGLDMSQDKSQETEDLIESQVINFPNFNTCRESFLELIYKKIDQYPDWDFYEIADNATDTIFLHRIDADDDKSFFLSCEFSGDGNIIATPSLMQ